MLTIKCGEKSFELTKPLAIKLEVCLNRSIYGHEWSHIGDVLYKYSTGALINVFSVNTVQYEFLEKMLLK
tara:strand:- start:232 stop:441 length:210 start_codon:yes stop_codon:yes gene_type:complete